MRIIAPLLLLALVAGCTPGPTGTPGTQSTSTKPSPAASSKAPTTIVASTSPSPAATGNGGVPNVGTIYTGITATVDGQPTKFTEHADRVYFGKSGLITIGALRTAMTLAVGEHQVQLSVTGKEKSPHTAGFSNADLQGVGWTLWIGDGKIFPNKFSPTGEPELQEESVADGKFNLRYKGKVKHMLNATEHTVDLTITDFPLQ